MFLGLNYIGIGVSDIEWSMQFYGNAFGFNEVMFDYTGHLPGMDIITGSSTTELRAVMLKNPNDGPAGLGMLKLVCLSPPNIPEACTVADTTTFADIGFNEVCFNMRGDVQEAYAEIVRKGAIAMGDAQTEVFPPYDARADFALMRDPKDNTLLEVVVWEQCRAFGHCTRIEGVNHVSFGVSDLRRTVKFYSQLGFTEEVFDWTGPSEILLPNGEEMAVKILANYHGAWIEPIQLLPPFKPTPFKKAWGHLGVMEIGIGVTDLYQAYEELRKRDIQFLSPPQTVEVSSGTWNYCYLSEPDNLYVALTEQRY